MRLPRDPISKPTIKPMTWAFPKSQIPSALLLLSFALYAAGLHASSSESLTLVGPWLTRVGAAVGFISLVMLAAAARRSRSTGGLLRFLAASIVVFFMLSAVLEPLLTGVDGTFG